MKSILFSLCLFIGISPLKINAQDFQGQAIYLSKSRLELGNWGANMTEIQKKQVEERLKNRLEKTYTLNFNKEASFYKEEAKLDAISGATDSWGKNFAPGNQYKNIKNNSLVQSQEFYGKYFLVKDELQSIKWNMGTETKQIGNYMCFKATATIPTAELTWYDFSWSDLRDNSYSNASETDDETETPEIATTEVEAWYTPQIPVSHGPGEYWGLPGLILEVSAGNTTMLCSKIILNPQTKLKIEAPDKGKEINKKDYRATIQTKMIEMRDNRMGRGRG
ncbi:GLPGLI family protein [Paucihalobacter sp.]|uniref:GLPGLI family protein n=1 Tax=Paucihalobacter sp. TaxID=2850405 RepID=UPI002FE08CC1